MGPVDRRTILRLLKGIPVMAFAPFAFLRNTIASRFPTRTVEEETFDFDPSTGEIVWTNKKSREPYRLVVDGLVENPLELSYEELKSLPRAAKTLDFHCVEGWTISDVTWSGFTFAEIMERARPKQDAKYAIFHALGTTTTKPQGWDHYAESFELKSLIDPKEDILLALELDGKPLPHDRGAPLRVIAPYRLAYKSIKFVHRVEFSDKLQPGWWTLANSIYDWKALVPKGRLRRK